MKILKYIVFAFVCAFAAFAIATSSGCRMAPTMRALASDNAAVQADIRTIYGTGHLSRVMPPTNSVTTIKPDGTITIDRK